MTVAPGAQASTAANTGTEAGRSSAAAILRATKMLRKMLRERSGLTSRIERRAGRSCRWSVAGGSAPTMAPSLRDYSRIEPRGPIVEKRRLRLASYDEALFIITTSPLDCPTASARPLPHHPAERRLVVPYRDLGQLPPYVGVVRQGRALLTQAVRRPSSSNLRRTGNCLARERAMGNEVMKNRSVIPNLTLSNTREPFHPAQPTSGPRV
jgi:hypothetical protein